jgi:hypothetical protein
MHLIFPANYYWQLYIVLLSACLPLRAIPNNSRSPEICPARGAPQGHHRPRRPIVPGSFDQLSRTYYRPGLFGAGHPFPFLQCYHIWAAILGGDLSTAAGAGLLYTLAWRVCSLIKVHAQYSVICRNRKGCLYMPISIRGGQYNQIYVQR